VAVERGLFLQLEVGGQSPQAVHLVADFAAAVSADWPRPWSCDCIHSTSEVSSVSSALPAAASFCFGFDRHGARGQVLGKRCGVLRIDLFERELVALKQLGNRRLNQRSKEARLAGVAGPECARRARRTGRNRQSSAGPPMMSEFDNRKS